MLKALTGKASSGDAAKSAIGLESGLVKSGYLVKRAKMSQSNWKKRYFVLNGHSLTYYKDIKAMGAAQGDLLLTDDTTCMAVQEANRGPCFDVNTPFSVLRMEAEDAKERDEWMQAIKGVVQELQVATRGYLWRKGTSMFATWSRKFFIVHEDSITCHEDHMKTSKIDIAVKLSDGNVTVEERADCVFAILRDGTDVMVLRAEEDSERGVWIKAVQAATGKENADAAAASAAPGGADGAGGGGGQDAHKNGLLLQSTLEVRSDKLRANNWDLHFFTLSNNTVKHYEDEKAFEANTPIESFRLSPQCCVFETNLAANAFELVTGKKVLHVAGASAKISEEWIRHLRRVITETQVTQGPLLDRVRERWGSHLNGQLEGPDFYEVGFETKKPLGLVLERSSEWAIVKLSNTSETGVSVGSVLYTINGKAVTQQAYPETIKQLTGWQPPLTLGFRHSPTQRGWLQKQSRGRNSSVKNWKARFFVLQGGRLSYFEDDKKGSEIKGDIQLMGSAVTLLSHAETGQFFCFRVVSGITAIVMQAKTVDEMMDWASVLYHSSSMNNGGGYLLEVEKQRLATLAEIEQKGNALKRAEEEALASKLTQDKAKAAASAAAEAEKKAKEEKEAAMAAAETAAAAASEEEKMKAAEEAACLEAAEQAAMAESARLKLEEAKASEEATVAAAEVATQEKARSEAEELLKEQEAKAAQDGKLQEEARNRALEEEAKADAAAAEAEEASLAAAEAEAEAAAPAAAAAAEAGGAPAAARPARGGRRPSVILNHLGDSEDEDDEKDKGSEGASPSPTDAPAPAAEAAAGAAAAGAPPLAEVPAGAKEAAAPAPAAAAAATATKAVKVDRVEVSQNMSDAVEGMVISDEMLEACFVNLNGGSPLGSLNPMQMSILVRLITKKHDLMQEMKWFANFDSDGVGGISLEEFKAGFRTIETTGLVNGYSKEDIALAIKSYIAHSNFAL